MYEGDWNNGVATGKGKFSWPSGATYQGQFKSGRTEGAGTFIGADGVSYIGSWCAELKFKEQSIIDRNPYQVQGLVQEKSGKTVATLFGRWDESMRYVDGDCTSKGKGHDSLSEAHLFWRRAKPPKFPTRYNLTRFAITLNELVPGFKENLPPTDSRLRPDQRCLENGEYDRSNGEKFRLEQRRRQARKMQESGWKPRWFAKDKGSDTYRYTRGYWEAREKNNWEGCPDIFSQIISDHILNE